MTRARELANFADNTSGLESLTVADITDLTATATEINKIDGFTGDHNDLIYAKDLRATGVTTTEFDKLDGLTASASDINSTVNQITDSSTDLNVDSNTLVVDKSANKVGIGTTSPVGILNVSDSGGFSTLVITDPTENASGEHWYFRNTGGNFYIGQSTDSGGAWDSLQARVAVLDGGNVGIGTTSPSCALHVHTENSASTNYLVQRWGNSTTTHGYVDFQLVNPGSTASGFPRLDLEIGNSPIMSFVRGGNVGIGTDSPDANSKLHISGGSADYETLIVDTTASGGGGMVLRHSGTYKGYVGTAGSTHLSGSSTDDILIRATNKLVFASGGNNERMRFDSSTGALIKNFTGSYAEGARFGPSQESGYSNNFAVAIASNDYLIRFADASYNVHGDIRCNGNGILVSSGSDYRVKENVTPLENALERLNKLSPKRFTWKNYPDLGELDGFIAHEVTEAVPEAVSGEKDRLRDNGDIWPQGLDMTKLVPLLTASIQELSAKVTALESA